MNKRINLHLCYLCLVAFFTHTICTKAQQPPQGAKPIVVSQTYPRDSRGEVVYDEQDDTKSKATPISGVFVYAHPLKKFSARIPVSSRMHHRKVNILLEGVVSANGDVIDVHILDDDKDEDLAKNCVEAFEHARFKPSTIDGKPVASLLQVPFSFNIF